MIQAFVDAFMAHKSEMFVDEHPGRKGIVEAVVRAISADIDEYGDTPDPTRITVIDHGDYQGTMLFVIAAQGYQPSNFWYVRMSYGSCSYCDTLQSIRDRSDWDSDSPTAEQANAYQTMALHVVQNMRKMEGGW